MPWPSNFEYILGGVDITIINVATRRTDMGTHRKRLLDNLTTPIAFLRGVAGVHADHLMSSTLSLNFKDIEERAPGGVHDAFCEMVVFDHAIDIQLLDGEMMIVLSILPSYLIMKITPLALDLEMSLCSTLGGFPPSLAALLPSRYRALLAPERLLARAVVARVLNGMPFTIGQEGLESDIDPNSRVLARRAGMLVLGFGLTDNERIPMTVSPTHEVSRFGRAFKRAMEFHLDGTAQLLGERQVLAIRGKREIGLVLSQLD